MEEPSALFSAKQIILFSDKECDAIDFALFFQIFGLFFSYFTRRDIWLDPKSDRNERCRSLSRRASLRIAYQRKQSAGERGGGGGSLRRRGGGARRKARRPAGRVARSAERRRRYGGTRRRSQSGSGKRRANMMNPVAAVCSLVVVLFLGGCGGAAIPEASTETSVSPTKETDMPVVPYVAG